MSKSSKRLARWRPDIRKGDLVSLTCAADAYKSAEENDFSLLNYAARQFNAGDFFLVDSARSNPSFTTPEEWRHMCKVYSVSDNKAYWTHSVFLRKV